MNISADCICLPSLHSTLVYSVGAHTSSPVEVVGLAIKGVCQPALLTPPDSGVCSFKNKTVSKLRTPSTHKQRKTLEWLDTRISCNSKSNPYFGIKTTRMSKLCNTTLTARDFAQKYCHGWDHGWTLGYTKIKGQTTTPPAILAQTGHQNSWLGQTKIPFSMFVCMHVSYDIIL